MDVSSAMALLLPRACEQNVFIHALQLNCNLANYVNIDPIICNWDQQKHNYENSFGKTNITMLYKKKLSLILHHYIFTTEFCETQYNV